MLRKNHFVLLMLSRINGIKSFPNKPLCLVFCVLKVMSLVFSSIFSFHVKRIGECILDISSIDNFEDEIYMEILNLNFNG